MKVSNKSKHMSYYNTFNGSISLKQTKNTLHIWLKFKLIISCLELKETKD